MGHKYTVTRPDAPACPVSFWAENAPAVKLRRTRAHMRAKNLGGSEFSTGREPAKPFALGETGFIDGQLLC
jgi:hypothetical protein